MMGIAQPSVLIVEDEPAMRSVLRAILATEGYQVVEAADGTNARQMARNHSAVNMVVLDLGLPDMDGLKLVAHFRMLCSKIRIIVLSSDGQERRKVDAFNLGADDYVTKPFGALEFLARLRAALRRIPQKEEKSPVFNSGDIVLDTARRLVTRGGKAVKLSPKEFELLNLLVSHAGKVLTNAFILDQLWGVNADVQYIRIYMRSLRQKLEDLPDQPYHILTEQGVGYRFRL
jgi:two-component system, OmpR family, KDP operon response regulator KdpE